MECSSSLGHNMDLRFDLEYIVENPEQTIRLASALDTSSVSAKKQAFELLAALCVYSREGFVRALQVLDHYKKSKNERYRFKFVVEELRGDQNVEYLTAVVTFVNCSIVAGKTLRERMQIRNEYLGLKILDAIARLRITLAPLSESELFVQLDIFEEQRLADEGQLTGPSGVDLSSHQDVFYAILRQVTETPLEIPFLNILQHLLRVDAALPISDVIWDTTEKLVHRATLCETREDSEKLLRAPSYHHSLNKLLRGLQEGAGVRCQCSCHTHCDGGGVADGRIRKRTPLQLNFCPPEGTRTPGILSPSNSSSAFNSELLAFLSKAISPVPKPSVPLQPCDSGAPPTSSPPPPPPPPPPPLPSAGSCPPPPPPLPGVPPSPPPPPSGPSVLPAKAVSSAAVKLDPRLPQQSTPKPRNKMKTLNWTKIATNKVVGRTNLWSLIARTHEGSPNPLDFDVIEGLFCQQNSVALSPKLESRDSLERRRRREPAEVNLLDGKRSLNVNIFLKQFRSSNEELIAILKRGAHGEIGAEKLRGLLKIFPESDEIELLRGYAGERCRLGNAEKFLLQLIELPDYKVRCEAMLLKEEFAPNVAYIEPAIETIEAAAEELQHCRDLHEVLYMLLVAGNFLNSGSYAGDAAGFKMMSLLKVTEIRSNKPGMSLIHYVVQEAENKFPNLLTFPDQLPNLEEASKLSIDNLKTEILQLGNRVKKILNLVSAAGQDIRQQMDEFLEFAAQETSSVQKEIENLEKVRVEMADFLCEDLQSFKLEECFKIFCSFCHKFRSAREENEKRRLQEKRAEERRKQREEYSLRKKTLVETRPSSFSGSESDNVIDLLLGDARAGVGRFADGGSFKSRSSKPTELHRMDSLKSSVASEEDAIPSPKAIRRRIGSSNSVANGDGGAEYTEAQSPDVTPNGTLRRRRNRLSSEDKDDNLMHYLRSTAEADKSKLSDGGSLDRSWFKRTSRRRRPEALALDLNDRERAASPLPERTTDPPQSEVSRPKQWRLKIEEWLQENEKEQEREKTLRDKAERTRRHDSEENGDPAKSSTTSQPLAKTDSEAYASRTKTVRQVVPRTQEETMPLKDKSRWRKSNLNVANSSESIDDERRRGRGKRNVSDPDLQDTISFYIRSSDAVPGTASPKQNEVEPLKGAEIPSGSQSDCSALPNLPSSNPVVSRTQADDSNREVKQAIQPIVLSSVVSKPNNQPIPVETSWLHHSASDLPESRDEKNLEISNKSIPWNTEEQIGSKPSAEDLTDSSDKGQEGNFDRFSYMRKTTRRSKSRSKPSENEAKADVEPRDGNSPPSTCCAASVVEQQNSGGCIDKTSSKFVKDALKEIDQCDRDIMDLKDDKVKPRGSTVSKYTSKELKNPQENDDQKKRSSLKSMLSKKLLSLTENLKGGSKYSNSSHSNFAAENKKPAILDAQLQSEQNFSMKHLKDVPLVPFNERLVDAGPDRDSPKMQKDRILKERSIPGLVTAEPTEQEVKCLPVPIGKEEQEKDEGFEETQSQLSELASQEACSSYDTDLADSPRSGRQAREDALPPQTKDLIKGTYTRPENPADNPQIYIGTAKKEDFAQNRSTERKYCPPVSSVKPREKKRTMFISGSDAFGSARDRTRNVEKTILTPFPGKPIEDEIERNALGSGSDAVQSSRDMTSNEENISCPPNYRAKSIENGAEKSSIVSRSGSFQSTRNRTSKAETDCGLPLGKSSEKPSSKHVASKLARNNILRGSKAKPKESGSLKAGPARTLRRLNSAENYDVTQSMPPTPSEENKTFEAGLNSPDGGPKARSALSVYNPRCGWQRKVNDPLGRRGSDRSLSSKRSSDRSLNLSRKSSETSIITVKSARNNAKLDRLSPREKSGPTRLRSSIQAREPRPPMVAKPVARSNSAVKSATVVPRSAALQRTPSDRSPSCGFMKATSASAAKTTPFRLAQEHSKPRAVRMTAKPIKTAGKAKPRC